MLRATPPSRRPTAARSLVALACAGLTLLSGCSGRSTFLSGGPTVGQMKTSLAHLEYENAQMKRDLAKLRRENRAIEDRLVQQEQDNGELTARLDDARNLLRDRGVDPAERAASHRDGCEAPGRRRRRQDPPRRPVEPKRRKPPVARIPGQFTPRRPSERQDGDEDGSGRRSP